MKRMTGFTLLEVLAAMVLLSLLVVGIYSGVRSATRGVRAGTAAVQRMDQIRSAQQFLRRELAQSLTEAIARNSRGENLYFEGRPHEMRYVAPLPGYLGKYGAQLQQLQLQDDGHGKMQLVVSLALLPPDGQPPKALGEPQVLLDDVRSGSFEYRGIDASGQAVAWTDRWPDGRLLPMLVRIQLAPQGGHDWPVLEIPLRVNPNDNASSNRLQQLLPVGGAP